MKPVPEIRGRFLARIFDKHGRLKKELVAYNGITDGGKDDLLDVMFHAGSQTVIFGWRIGLIDADSFSGLAAADTMVSHAGWIEFEDYDEISRPIWLKNPPSGQQLTTLSPVVYTISASGTVKGFFIVNNFSKGGTTGILWSTALFAEGDQVVASSDTIEVTYTLTAAGA